MRRVVTAVLLTATAACVDVTASDTAETTVQLTPKAGNAVCVKALPDPVSVRVNQGLGFTNRGSAELTIILVDDNTPLVSVSPSQTSGGIKFGSPGMHEYYIQGCGSAGTERHRITVTIN